MAPTGKSTSTSRTATTVTDVESYIKAAPSAAQPHLRQLRALIRQLAPKAEERISYGIVGYFYPTRMIYFGGHAKHVALYPAGEAKGLEKYLYGASTLRFPLDEPLPIAKIRSLVRSRVKEYEAAAKGKPGAAAARGYGTARSKQ